MKITVVVAFLLFGFYGLNAQIKPHQDKTDSIAGKTPTDTLVTKMSDSLSEERLPEFSSIHPVPSILEDSIKMLLKDYKISVRIDSLWQEELLNSDLYPKMRKAVLETPYAEADIAKDTVYRDLPTDTLKKRLARLNAKTPFNISYNKSLESVIHYYLRRNKKSMERLMSLSTYYFPLFEKGLDQHDIPLELKYLPIVESALNPRAKSRVGATGLWQFMFATGRMKGLTVSSYVDERMDPVKSTEAACEYLSSLYRVFGDWDLVLASYNSGPGNVSKAIRRSGGKTNYWNIRRHLPRETAGYVPSFLATLYIFNYAEEHGFEPYRPLVTYFETDTIKVKQQLKFEEISKTTGIDEDLLSFLNPSYKLDIIPHVEGKDYYLRLPVREAGLFVANEDTIYGYAKKKQEKEKQPRYFEADEKIRYRVQPGDYLGKIAARYGVGVSKIRRWNHMSNNNIRVGQRLVIYPRKAVASKDQGQKSTKKSTKKSKSSAPKKVYTVKKGDSLWSISRKFNGLTVRKIKKWNGISGKHLKPGMVLKISEG